MKLSKDDLEDVKMGKKKRSSKDKSSALVYCATPSRMAHRKDEICDHIVKQGFLPFHPFYAFPYKFYEGHPKVGRKKTMKTCLDAIENCEEFWLFGVSEGTLEELVHSIKIGKKVKLFMDLFDPEWRNFYRDLGFKYGDPLREISNLTTVEEICQGYEEWMKTDGTLSCSLFDPSAEKIVSKFNCGREQIEEFSKILPRYKNLIGYNRQMDINDLASFYLCDLMRASKENEFTLDLRNANKKGIFLNWLTCPSQIKRGLKIYGSVGDHVGYEGDGIVITIDGNAQESVGTRAENSKIYIRGKYKSISEEIGTGTEVYQEKNRRWEKKLGYS